MKFFQSLFQTSSKELKNLKSITLLAMLGALSIVLGYFTIMPLPSIKINATFLPNEFVYYLFGPVTGAIFGASMDVLTYLIRPTGPFFFGFTLSACLNGFLFGILLYKRPLSLLRIATANLLQMIFINLLLNTYWISMLYGTPFLVLLPARFFKAIVMLPIETTLFYLFVKAVEATKVLRTLHSA
ncbi:MAG: riboflavin transporter [Clostridiales bacterium]|nr:riboflavin transporter [Clostridiales bacterium]